MKKPTAIAVAAGSGEYEKKCGNYVAGVIGCQHTPVRNSPAAAVEFIFRSARPAPGARREYLQSVRWFADLVAERRESRHLSAGFLDSLRWVALNRAVRLAVAAGADRRGRVAGDLHQLVQQHVGLPWIGFDRLMAERAWIDAVHDARRLEVNQ